MVGGQYLDVAGVGDTPEELRRLHALKTGRLIGASVVCVLLLAGMDETETPRGGASPPSSASSSRSSTTSST